MTSAVKCINLSKRYGKNYALNSVSINIEKNKIYGLLGRNGAGKTTLLNIIAAQTFKTEGIVEVLGKCPVENAKVLNQICMVKEAGAYLNQLKVKDILGIAANFYSNWDKEFACELLKKFELPEKKRFIQLSKGMQSSMSIVVGLASRSPLTIYDEPYVALDAAARNMFYEILLEDYMKNPRTIILSTHLIDEVSRIFENIIILEKGTVLLSEEVETLRGKALYLYGEKSKLQEAIAKKRVLHFETIGNTASASVYDSFSQENFNELKQNNIDIKPLTLQDFFIRLTGKR